MSLESLIQSGRIADIILAILVIEMAVVGIAMRRAAALPQLLAGMAAGGSLVLALRAALTDTGSGPIALFLTLGLLAHVIELRLAWKTK